MEYYLEFMSENQPSIYDYELVEFYPAGSYSEKDGSIVTLFNFDYGLLTDDPLSIEFAGGMHFDGWLRLRGFNGGGQFAVRHRDSRFVAYAFMGNDFGYYPDSPYNTAEIDEMCKSRLKSALDDNESHSDA